jgi:hypothetical protein
MFRERHVPPKRLLTFYGLHRAITQKIELIITTVDITSNYTYSVALVRIRTIPTEQQPLVGEISANFYK